MDEEGKDETDFSEYSDHHTSTVQPAILPH